MRLRALVVLASLLLPALAHAKKPRGQRRAHAHHVRKMRISRDQAKQESLAAWPDHSPAPRQIEPIGVPELDRLITAHPPVGVSLSDPVADLDLPDRPMAKESRPEGVLGSTISAGTDPVQRLKAVAEPLLGSPYRSGGEDPLGGFDCSGFVRTVLRFFGQNIEGRSSPDFWRQGQPVSKDDLQPGDLLFFSDHTRSIGHVAMYLADGKFVHATTQRGVIVSAMDEEYYVRRYKGARRLTEFAHKLRAEPASDTTVESP
jgi:cell wall-associated NlpC family hydrolase